MTVTVVLAGTDDVDGIRVALHDWANDLSRSALDAFRTTGAVTESLRTELVELAEPA